MKEIRLIATFNGDFQNAALVNCDNTGISFKFMGENVNIKVEQLIAACMKVPELWQQVELSDSTEWHYHIRETREDEVGWITKCRKYVDKWHCGMNYDDCIMCELSDVEEVVSTNVLLYAALNSGEKSIMTGGNIVSYSIRYKTYDRLPSDVINVKILSISKLQPVELKALYEFFNLSENEIQMYKDSCEIYMKA